MRADVDVRPLTFGDLPQVVAVERRAFVAPWSLSMFVLELSKPDGVCLAATLAAEPQDAGGVRRGDIVGYVICSRYDTVWHVMNVAVDPMHRRMGIGTRLLEALLAIVGDDARLTLEVRTTNVGAIALYRALGFLPAGLRHRYYADNGEDATIMWRTPATLRGRLDDVPAADPAGPER